jgi:hypothetical protein
MNKWMCHTAVMVSMLCIHAVMPRESSAGPLLEWLSGRTPYYQPQPWHIDRRYPRALPPAPQVIYAGQEANAAGVAYQQPIQTTPGVEIPQVIQQTPTFESAPIVQPMTVPQATCTQGVPQNTRCGLFGGICSWFRPRSRYRTTWVRVPVTRYRPVIGTAGTAYGVPATQPCRGYVWRMRRVPVTTLRPFAGWSRQRCAPPGRASYFGTQVCAPSVPYGTAVPLTSPQQVPYYPAQPGAVPGTTSVVPNAGLGSPATQGGVAPADRRPTLNPNGVPTNDPSTMFPARPNMTPLAAPSASTIPPALAPATVDGPSTVARPAAPAVTTTPPAGQPQRGNYFDVSPVRDPDAKADGGVSRDDPQFFGPNNHSAANDRNDQVRPWQVVPIKWESVRRDDVPQPNTSRQSTISRQDTPQPPRRNWDDGGWHSAR